jgi:hypothetical protein
MPPAIHTSKSIVCGHAEKMFCAHADHMIVTNFCRSHQTSQIRDDGPAVQRRHVIPDLRKLCLVKTSFFR